MTNNSDKDQHSDIRPDGGMHVDIGHLSASGNVVISGRDGSVYVNTGGNVEHQTTQTITVGGVETTREALEQMMTKIQSVQTAIVESNIDEETQEAAEYDLKTLQEQLTNSKKPNAKILVKAARGLYRISPMLASAVFALFNEPLASQIMMAVGGVATQFVEAIMKRHTNKS